MRTIFIAVSKVFGLLQLYAGLAYIASALPVMFTLGQSTSSDPVSIRTAYGSVFAISVAGMTTMLVLTFTVAWLLLFRSEWLADKLKIPEQDAQVPLDADAILGAGTRLLGIFFVVQSAPTLIGNLGRTICGIRQIMSITDSMATGVLGRTVFSEIWYSIVAPAIKLASGLLLAFKTDAVLDWMITSKQKKK